MLFNKILRTFGKACLQPVKHIGNDIGHVGNLFFNAHNVHGGSLLAPFDKVEPVIFSRAAFNIFNDDF